MYDLFGEFDSELPPILGFKDSYPFLSNFWLCEVVYKGIVFTSAEQAYVWSKTDDPELKALILSVHIPAKLKRMGAKFTLMPNWKTERLPIMKEIIDCKFSDYLMAGRLISTGMRYIEETNWWGDTFWGVCDGVGENNLGRLLMEKRSNLNVNT